MSLAVFITQLKLIGACLEPVDTCPPDLERIPLDYQEFLRLANGLQVSGLRLLGTRPMRLAGGHWEADIFTATEDDMGLCDEGIVLGHIGSDLLITYNEINQHYELLDKSCGDVHYTYSSLLEVLERWKKWHPHLFNA